MEEKIQISIYQHSSFDEGTLLFEFDTFERLLEKCEQIFAEKFPNESYPTEQVKSRFKRLLTAVSLKKSIRIKIRDQELSWESLVAQLSRSYPQIVWIKGFRIDGVITEYYFDFIPLVVNESGFVFGTSLPDSLGQQGVPDDEDVLIEWAKELYYLVEDMIGGPIDYELASLLEVDQYSYQVAFEDDSVLSKYDEEIVITTDYFDEISSQIDNVSQSESVESTVDPSDEYYQTYLMSDGSEEGFFSSDFSDLDDLLAKYSSESSSNYDETENYAEYVGAFLDRNEKLEQTEGQDEENASETFQYTYTVDSDELIEENSRLRRESEQLREDNRKLGSKLTGLEESVNTQILLSEEYTSPPQNLDNQVIYFEEALKRERNAKERMRFAKEKLEHLVSRLERQVMVNSMNILDSDVPYVDRKKDWYRKKKIDLIEYDLLYQKAKYLEHTWEVNQRLVTISDQLTIGESDLHYERERVNQIKYSAKDIELFVMMDECRMINERVKIRKGFLWLKPKVIIMTGDYENLQEKAAYFDVIQSENQLLERIIVSDK